MILLIDNYDSFTYNLAQALGSLGPQLHIARNDAITLTKISAMPLTHIVISPGPCTPDKAGISMAAIRHFAGHLPILGVCLGHQALGQAYGARVIRAPAAIHGRTAPIAHDGKTLFRGIKQPMQCARYHSLILERESLPACFDISASFDNLIMAIRHKEIPCLEGIQFHPESFLTPAGPQLLTNFLEMRIK